jgi:hypothetical protein
VILGVSAERIAVSPFNNSGPVEVLALQGGGERIAQLTTNPFKGAVAIPIDARMSGEDIYVLCAPSLSGRRKSAYGRMTNARGLNLQKFSIAGQKLRWSRDFPNQGQSYFPSVLPMVLGKDHIVVTARHHQLGQPYYAYVLSTHDGQIAKSIDLRGGAGPALKNESRRRYSIGQPVMTNGRLCVETSQGVTVYGER